MTKNTLANSEIVSCMMRLIRMMLLFAIILGIPASRCVAATVVFLGQPFSSALGPEFVSGVDRVYGTITFDAIGNSQARSISLTATSGGAPAFGYTVANTNAPPPGITVANNSFSNWQNGLPTQWNLTLFGNVTGTAQEEQITIHSVLGDLAAIDLLNQIQQSVGTNRLPGQMSAIPEPSSFVMMALPLINVLSSRRRCRSC